MDIGNSIVPTVAVVIPVYNRAAFLRAALQSVAAQTHPVQEVIVVDDGSADDPASIVAEFPGVKLLRQANQGPSIARNVGLHAAGSDYIVFLDSDDLLLPNAIADNLACMALNPGVALVYGAHLRVNAELEPFDRPFYTSMARYAYHDLLLNNFISMLGTVMFDRAKLLKVGGFDPEVALSEDYDLFLRLSKIYPFASGPELIAKYRIHESNLTSKQDVMLQSALAVLERNRPPEEDRVGMKAYRRGRKLLPIYYAMGLWRRTSQEGVDQDRKMRWAFFWSSPITSIMAMSWQFIRRHLSNPLISRLRHLISKRMPPIGTVQFGDLARRRPISRVFGYDRGTPIDRYFVESFLERCKVDIQGRVLEIGDDAYSRKFGSGITHMDVLHVDSSCKEATIIGDLSRAGTLPVEVFDCMVVTQTLDLIYEVKAAVQELHRGLKPGGILLATLPGVASVSRNEFRNSWYWSMTELSARRLFEDVFGREGLEIQSFGNVYSATCFLQGLALEEVEVSWLDEYDPSYPMIIAVRARRPAAS